MNADDKRDHLLLQPPDEDDPETHVQALEAILGRRRRKTVTISDRQEMFSLPGSDLVRDRRRRTTELRFMHMSVLQYLHKNKVCS